MQPILGTQPSKDGRLDERRASPTEQPGKTFPTVKAVAILEAMATARRPLGVSELGALLGLPKPTAHRIVRMLETEGLLQREPGSRRFVPGSRVPLHCTSMGKLFLSQLPEKKRPLLVRSIPLYRYTENTITEAVKLEAELEAIRKTEISIDNQEFLAGVVCVAVPVRSAGGQRVAALAISAPLARMSLEQGLQHVPLLQATADRLTATIDESGQENT